MKKTTVAAERFGELITIMARLRGEQGCPWDKEQTHASLKPFLLEEAYELLDAIEREDIKGMEEELGDLMLQIVGRHIPTALKSLEFIAKVRGYGG